MHVPPRYLETETERVQERGEQNRKRLTCMLLIRHISYFYNCWNCQFHNTARGKKEQDLHLSSRHSARNTLLGQYFCNSLSTRARLLVPKNANQDATASLSRRLGAKGSQTTSPVSFSFFFSLLPLECLYNTTDGLCLSYRTEKSIWWISQWDCQSFYESSTHLMPIAPRGPLSLSLSGTFFNGVSLSGPHWAIYKEQRFPE